MILIELILNLPVDRANFNIPFATNIWPVLIIHPHPISEVNEELESNGNLFLYVNQNKEWNASKNSCAPSDFWSKSSKGTAVLSEKEDIIEPIS